MGTFVTPAKQMQNWCQPPKAVDFDSNHEPTAADHGDVLYVIKKDPVVGRYMVAARDIKPSEVIFTDQPAVVGKSLVLQVICPVSIAEANMAARRFRGKLQRIC